MIFILLAARLPVFAQTNEPAFDFGDLLDTAQQWAQSNLDTNVVAAVVQNVGRQQVEDFLSHYQDYLNGDYVLDVAQLKDAANAILPALEANEDTKPYAAWLRARMDYFDVATDLKTAAPVPKPAPGTNQPPPSPNPPYAAEQEIWIKKVAPRPLPKGAVEMVPKLKTIFADEQVPTALVWLAEVESDFDPTARSPAGALGLFQLMPATAKDLGLSLWPFDQRKQLDPSAHAAATYLRQLHDKFGDWLLALAAYNCGQGRVQKLLQRYKTDSYSTISPH
ncbi:MAG TPA: lytic transglycosylase domain-containing protein, partial [Candidatus Binatia bacterium]|nr:lytic transglycosylase domain-containing protein [Candidatus Binatia bacterium]